MTDPQTPATALREALHARSEVIDDTDWWARRLGARNGSNYGMAQFVVGTINRALAAEPHAPLDTADRAFIAEQRAYNEAWLGTNTAATTARWLAIIDRLDPTS